MLEDVHYSLFPTNAMRTPEFLDCLSDITMREAQEITRLSKTVIYSLRKRAGLDKGWPFRAICGSYHDTLNWASVNKKRNDVIETTSDIYVRLLLMRVKSAALTHRIFNDKEFAPHITTPGNPSTSLVTKTFLEFFNRFPTNTGTINYQSVLLRQENDMSSVCTFASTLLHVPASSHSQAPVYDLYTPDTTSNDLDEDEKLNRALSSVFTGDFTDTHSENDNGSFEWIQTIADEDDWVLPDDFDLMS